MLACQRLVIDELLRSNKNINLTAKPAGFFALDLHERRILRAVFILGHLRARVKLIFTFIYRDKVESVLR